jgi:hypothetical protein
MKVSHWIRSHRSLVGVLALVLVGGAMCASCFSTAQPRVRLSQNEAAALTVFPFDLWDEIVRAVVNDRGEVNYVALRRDPARLDRFIAAVADAGPRRRPDLFATQGARLAFAINAYNATVFRNVINRPPYTVNTAINNFFYFTKFVIDGQEINLKNYEDEHVREAFHDPRVHFALNCASVGCPWLPNEAFRPERIEEQLDREARRFCTQERNVRVDTAARKVVLSQIFEWYADDFRGYETSHGNPNGTQIHYINRWRPADAQVPTDFSIEFTPYDWTLNAQPASGQSPTS